MRQAAARSRLKSFSIHSRIKWFKSHRKLPLTRVSTRFFKKLSGTELYEFRIRWESNIYRLLCFFDRDNKVVITHGFVKKAQKTPD